MGRVLYSNNGSQVQSYRKQENVVSAKSKKEPKDRTGKIMFAIATVFILVGVIWFSILNTTRYENRIGKAKRVNVTVQGVTKQTDTEQFENAEAQIERYHLTGQYQDGAYTRDVVLNEGYIDEEQAQSFIGQRRKVAIDTISLQNLVDRGVSYFCGIPVCVGLICYIVLGLVYIKRQ